MCMKCTDTQMFGLKKTVPVCTCGTGACATDAFGAKCNACGHKQGF